MLVIRKLSVRESERLKHHLGRLSQEDRRLRFGHFVNELGLAHYVDAIDWAESWAVGAFEGAQLRGIVEVRRGTGAPSATTAELSVSVEESHQNQGLGSRLVAEALLVARNRNIRSVFLLCLPENRPIQKIARKFAGRLTSVDGDLEARIRPPLATPLSIMAEIFNDSRAIAQALLAPASFNPVGSRGS